MGNFTLLLCLTVCTSISAPAFADAPEGASRTCAAISFIGDKIAGREMPAALGANMTDA